MTKMKKIYKKYLQKMSGPVKLIYVSRVNGNYVAYTPGCVTLHGKTIRDAVSSVMFIMKSDNYRFIQIMDSTNVFEFEVTCKFIETHLSKYKSHGIYEALNFHKEQNDCEEKNCS